MTRRALHGDGGSTIAERVAKSRKRAKDQVARKARAVQASAVDPLEWRARKRPISDSKAPGVVKNAESRKDDAGKLSHPHRVHDTLAALSRCGRITLAQYSAGRLFEETCANADQATLGAAPLERLGGAGGPHARHPTEAALAAISNMRADLRALAGLQAATGLVAWLVLREGLTLRETADRLTYLPSGKHGEQAVKWQLVAALDILAVHYGYSQPRLDLDRCTLRGP